MKYTNKIINAFAMVFAVSFTFNACITLDEDISSIISIEKLDKEEDVVAGLAAIYRRMANVYQFPQYQRTATYGADDITTWWAGNKAPLRVFDRFDYGSGENSDNEWLFNSWNGYWNVIYFANTLIHGLKSSGAPLEVVNSADGEARFLRALAYFHLVRTWGGMPIIIDGNTPTGDEERATVLETYKLIENDLQLAINKLPGPTSVKNVGRVSSAAAKALLADLYLTWAGWPVKDESKYTLAANLAKEVIDMNRFKLLEIDKLWLQINQNSLESVFAFQFSEAENIESRWAMTFSFHMASGWSDAYPELQFFYNFPAGPRKDATFVVDIPNRGMVDGKIVYLNPPTKPWQESDRLHPMYKKFTISENLNLNMGGKAVGFRAVEVIRYAEVLLIYAEAQARIGENPSSLEALNQVKRRAAGLPYLVPDQSVDVTTATPNEIVDERGWELAGEYKRWFDLIRTERLEEIAAKRHPAEQVVLLRQPTKAQYIAPLPASAFLHGSKLKQNPEGFIIK
jgi:starch-binding outer membrane protein, SusD/RagB family